MLLTNTCTWTQLKYKWHQKIHVNAEGKLAFSYHYGSKIKSANQVIELKTAETKEWCSYKLIEKDLRDLKKILQQYSSILKNIDELYSMNNTPPEGIIAKALLTAIVVHYNRCFPGGNKRTKTIQRKDISKSNLHTHDLLKVMRDTYIAHSDHSIFEKCNFILLIPPRHKVKNKQGVMLNICELGQAFGFENGVEDINKLIDELYEIIQKKINKLESHILNKLQKINPDKIYKYLKGKSKRAIITQTDLYKIINM